MSVLQPAMRLTALSHGAGCACKLSLDELAGVLGGVGWAEHPDLVVGVATGDDAAVWRQPGGRVLVATTDFFTPLVDDPETWGRIAAANAVSDVYAMGATPRFALNLVGWPRAVPFELLQQVLHGGAALAAEAGYPVVGGHTIDSREPLYGQVVIGDADEEDLLTNAGAQPGQLLVLTKALGTGIVTTAVKRCEPEDLDGDTPLATAYRSAVASMTRLNDHAARIALRAGASAATDVTGFGLLGHLHRLASASGVACRVEPDAVPLLPEAGTLLDAGFVPGGTRRNVEQSARYVRGRGTERQLTLLCDAQTSGGLLFSVDTGAAASAVDELRQAGHDAAIVGEVRSGEPGTIELGPGPGRGPGRRP
jgi:selenide, water dikinase